MPATVSLSIAGSLGAEFESISSNLDNKQMGSRSDNNSRRLGCVLGTSEIPKEREGPCRGWDGGGDEGTAWPPVSCWDSFVP